jgi:hypothetical protein
MKKQGYAESTIEATGKRLRNIARHVSIEKPEQVRAYIQSALVCIGFEFSHDLSAKPIWSVSFLASAHVESVYPYP